jgi:AraC family transcriptional regulator, transcriptional activator of the genes for pyochelin and ferripyochelin receptors
MKREAIKSHDLPFIHAAAEILRKDPRQSFTISSLALEVGINSFKLREGFKKVFSRTVYQYRIVLKLQLIMQLLEETDLTIEQIAHKTGFDSRDSMSRCFRTKLRQSPSEWRNRKASKACDEITAAIALFSVPSTN